MTTIVAWVSYQNGKPSALTFASDSRLSWSQEGARWDFGRKIFWCKNTPDVFGFAGDVVTQSTILSQVCEIFDYATIEIVPASAESRHRFFVDLAKSAVGALKGVVMQETDVLHGLREEEGGGCSFRLWRTRFAPLTGTCTDDEMKFSPRGLKSRHDDPGQFFSAGSGSDKHRNHWQRRIKEAGDTSRSVFRALVDVIDKGEDARTGGLPQIVSLGRTGFPKPVGVSINDARSVCGMPLGESGAGGTIEWRDENFQFLKPQTLLRKSNAPEHYFK